MDDTQAKAKQSQKHIIQNEVLCPYASQLEENEIYLFGLLDALRRRWKRISIITFLGMVGAFAYALLSPPRYMARAVIVPPPPKQAGASSAALAAFGGVGAEIAGTLGVPVGSTDATRLVALLKSHRLLERVVAKYTLLPILFAKKWDEDRHAWRIDAPDQMPNIWDAESLINKTYSVNNDMKNGVIRISFEWDGAAVAEAMLRQILNELGFVMKEDELRKIEMDRTFAKEQLETATDPVIVAKLQALLSEQVEKAMMAQNVDHFAFETIDPPAASDQKTKPNRKMIISLGLMVSLFSGIVFALFVEWWQNAKLEAESE